MEKLVCDRAKGDDGANWNTEPEGVLETHPPRRTADETVREIIRLRFAGRSLRKIAADLFLSHGSVQRLLKKTANSEAVAPSPARIPKRAGGRQLLAGRATDTLA